MKTFSVLQIAQYNIIIVQNLIVAADYLYNVYSTMWQLRNGNSYPFTDVKGIEELFRNEGSWPSRGLEENVRWINNKNKNAYSFLSEKTGKGFPLQCHDRDRSFPREWPTTLLVSAKYRRSPWAWLQVHFQSTKFSYKKVQVLCDKSTKYS